MLKAVCPVKRKVTVHEFYLMTEVVAFISARERGAAFCECQLKSVDLVNAYISRIQEINPVINAAVNFRFERALEEAQEIDDLIASDYRTEEEMERETPFLGVPMSVKELIAVEGMPFTAGLVSRKNVRSPNSAQTVKLMKAAGAIPLVTTNISELGMWYESYNRVYGRTSNPYDTSRSPGGSSGMYEKFHSFLQNILN
ncbi:fatty-acid amide hydrolase 2 [Trichonephila inaurata madagascariensis]|uniref:Fatty-acid amide hydrolase 2 n=1 Tax=Trichonephila inaurata madagascariensis TaxID=2747483 RepID=A0A8X7CNN9_9ARAC|nr:fatty-acid amide hydrolase 2 [Trichonephila inaurata madagascariensis]